MIEHLPDHMSQKIAVTAGCWLWTGSKNRAGYGVVNFPRCAGVRQRQALAHREVYSLLVGPIPPSYHLDHVRAWGCTNRHCVNPAHLEPVTNQENNRRSDSLSAINARKTHCKRGHVFDVTNTLYHIHSKTGRTIRMCRTCNRLSQAALRRSRRPDQYTDTTDDLKKMKAYTPEGAQTR